MTRAIGQVGIALCVAAALLGCTPATQRPRLSPGGQRHQPQTAAPGDAASAAARHRDAEQDSRAGALYDPGDRALARFYRQLRALVAGQRHRVRISQWGDSHVAAEVLTGRLRSLLQRRFGDGGPGFFIPGQPWRSYRHGAVRYGVDRRWRAERLWARYGRRRLRPRDDLFGVAGISVHARRPARAWVAPRRGALDAVQVHYLEQPGGGRLQIQGDGELVRQISTAASAPRAGYVKVLLSPPARRIELRTAGGEVRLFGVDLLRNATGVVYDAFGINGARASSQLKWNESLMADQIRRLDPQLVIVAYGNNEIDDSALTAASVYRQMDMVLMRLRRAAPAAACLVIGAVDQARRDAEQGWIVPPQLDVVIDAQRRLAGTQGCAFWNQREAMGGPGTIFEWVAADPPLARGDRLHMTARGYRWLADALFNALMQRFDAIVG